MVYVNDKPALSTYDVRYVSLYLCCLLTQFVRLKVSSIEQETLSLINRVSHPNLTHYLAVNVQESTHVKVQVIRT